MLTWFPSRRIHTDAEVGHMHLDYGLKVFWRRIWTAADANKPLWKSSEFKGAPRSHKSSVARSKGRRLSAAKSRWPLAVWSSELDTLPWHLPVFDIALTCAAAGYRHGDRAEDTAISCGVYSTRLQTRSICRRHTRDWHRFAGKHTHKSPTFAFLVRTFSRNYWDIRTSCPLVSHLPQEALQLSHARSHYGCVYVGGDCTRASEPARSSEIWTRKMKTFGSVEDWSGWKRVQLLAWVFSAGCRVQLSLRKTKAGN